jgi:hypothetical protein
MPAADALRAPTMVECCHVAAHGEERRGVVDHAQAVRIVRLAQRQQGDAESPGRRELALGVLARVHARGTACAAAAGEIGQGREGGSGAAAVIDQGAEGARPDMVAADEAQPVETLFVGQAGGFEHGTYPSRSTGP